MSLIQSGAARHGGRPIARSRRTRLAVARHAEGTDALGWVLLGFLMGAGAAIALLVHADPARQLLAVVRPPAAPSRSAPIARLANTIAVSARAQPARPQPPASASALATAPRAIRSVEPPAPNAEVAEDAASAGLTARAATDTPDLY